ncbi:MAG: OmpA family protein [Mariniphaga sp.]|nr:OmpA family protein [Mariniphaga sp.]
MKKIGFTILSIALVILSNAQQKRTVLDNVDFIVEPVRLINTIGSDISPAFVDDSIYFSAVPEKYFNKTRREKKNMAFYNIYSAALDENGIIASTRVLVPGFGSEFHEGPADYCEATGELFVTLSNTIDADTIQKMFSVENFRLRLAIKKFIDGKWQITEELPFNQDTHHYAHPAISLTGDTLVFSSDRDSTGYGQSDLYMSVRTNGEWSAPVNLGETVNTPGNEMFPTFIQGGLLSFASDGRQGGYGGLDIYVTSFPEIGEIKNLGNKINTHLDDFGLVIHPNGNVGYFASNRGGVGSDDIFRLDIIRLYYVFNGKVRDDRTDLLIAGSRVDLYGCNGAILHTVYSDSEGNFTFEVLKNNCPVVEASKEGFSRDRKDISGLSYIELRLRQKQTYEVLVLDKDNDFPVGGAEIACNDEAGRISNSRGIASFVPPFPHGCELFIRKEGYLDQTLIPDTTKFVHVVNRDTVWLYKKELEKTFVLENIYYDFDKWNILPESEIELQKLIKIMNDNPTLRVELGSHTDSRGSDQYNEWLSQKRSDSAVGYIIDNGISKDRIVAKGYGEYQLINHCKNGVQCADAEHRKNRRTEFKIIGF